MGSARQNASLLLNFVKVRVSNGSKIFEWPVKAHD